jgi:hypothetical protein
VLLKSSTVTPHFSRLRTAWFPKFAGCPNNRSIFLVLPVDRSIDIFRNVVFIINLYRTERCSGNLRKKGAVPITVFKKRQERRQTLLGLKGGGGEVKKRGFFFFWGFWVFVWGIEILPPQKASEGGLLS